ncbi:helix-turn-helix domain-containing protein [Bizionia sediminis]|uniref:Helix-turn-helix domain-containing protein n=1 Tax=Bizionia sediminis TaxID=1737064 RepID=A0ABW5KQC3_9FLAO
MTLFVKYDYNQICKTILKEQFHALNIEYTYNNHGEITIHSPLTDHLQQKLEAALNHYGIKILSNQKDTLVERIKTSIDTMLRSNDLRTVKVSTYLSEKLHYSYAHLSSVFSENTYTSIENYMILKKVDLVKERICTTNLTLTEIAYQLDYSSVAHLSGQFKKTTGLTPSKFQKIMKNKRH